jgi:hypothetical protein
VVDHELGRRERVDLVGVAAQIGDGLAHGGEVDDAGHAREVLHDHAGRGELDLGVGLGRGIPTAERLDVRAGDVRAVLGAQQVLEQHLEAVGQALVARYPIDPEDLVFLLADGEGALRTEAVDRCHCSSSTHVPTRRIRWDAQNISMSR